MIKQEDLLSTEEACQLLNVSGTTLRKFIKNKHIRRVKDATNKCFSYVYKPDAEALLSSRFYFEDEV